MGRQASASPSRPRSPSSGVPPAGWGPINESANDSVHQYDAAANWVGGTVADSLANVTLTDSTTLYLAGDHATAGDLTLTYGSGQKFLSFQSATAAGHTFTLNGNVNLATLGGSNSVYFSVPARPLTLAMASPSPTFSLAANNAFYVDGPLAGSSGLTVAGGGSLVFRNGGKAVTGAVTVAAGSRLSAGDGSPTGIATGNLSAAASYAVNGNLQLAGISGSPKAETVAGLSGSGVVSGANPAGSTLTVAAAQRWTFAGSLTGAALSLVQAGPATLSLSGGNTYAALTTVAAGTLAVSPTGSVAGGLTVDAGAALLFASGPVGGGVLARPVGSLTVNAGGTAAVVAAAAAPGDRTVLVTTGLSLGGTLDLDDGDAIVRNGSLSAVTALATAGFAAGTWSGGAGLVSSTAAADAAHLTAIGVAQNAFGPGPLYTTFDGQPASATDVLVRCTEYGDSNLDGLVTAADYTRVDAGFVDHLTGWANGDFNYDGVVDGSDYTLMDNTFNQQSTGLGSPALAVPSVAAPSFAIATVPEPATGGLLAFAAVRVGRRRR